MKDIKSTLELYSLTLVIPILLSMLNLACSILGIKTLYGFWVNFKIIWVNYYFSGTFLNIDAWRCHLLILLSLYFFVKSEDYFN
jgi:hypothetical protein